MLFHLCNLRGESIGLPPRRKGKLRLPRLLVEMGPDPELTFRFIGKGNVPNEECGIRNAKYNCTGVAPLRRFIAELSGENELTGAAESQAVGGPGTPAWRQGPLLGRILMRCKGARQGTNLMIISS